MTIQNPTGPSLYNNNDVFSFIDFRSSAVSMAGLTGSTVTIGDTTYTAGTTWLPKFFDSTTNIDPAELASSLVEAINGTYESAPNKADLTDKIGRANTQASAYAEGGIVHLVKRGTTIPTVGTDVPGTPAPEPLPSTSTPIPDVFYTAPVNAAPNPLPSAPTARSFSIDNMNQTYPLYITRDDVNFITIYPETGRTFSGDPGLYKAYYDIAAGDVLIQMVVNYNN